MENSDSLRKLKEQFEKLVTKQSEINKEIFNLKSELYKLESDQKAEKPTPEKVSFPDTDRLVEESKKSNVYIAPSDAIPSNGFQAETKPPVKHRNLEKFVGENLISKIGIAILVIGVAIGSKYAIDNIVFSPILRISSGYAFGILLLLAAYWLKSKYTGYSAVLLSGAMAIFYFVSYAGFSFYSFFSQEICFSLMLVFTAYTVFAAIQYNQQIIAHIGLIGAYIIPFLVSSSTDNYPFLFSYIALVNLGILVIAIKKYWKTIYLSSFIATYTIFFGWFVIEYSTGDFILGIVFLSIYFLLFYATFLIYKLINKTKYGAWDIILIISNSFIFYAVGMALIEQLGKASFSLSSFTLLNAAVHSIVAMTVLKRNKNDKAFFYLTAGLVVIFLTLLFPVQFDGSWVTLMWGGEAFILFMVGRFVNKKEYEFLSYPLIVLSFISLVHDWVMRNDGISAGQSSLNIPFFNIVFLTALILATFYLVIYFQSQKRKYLDPTFSKNPFTQLFNFSLPLIMLTTLYFTFELEIGNYWNLKHIASKVEVTFPGNESATYIKNHNIQSFHKLWVINYSIVFLSIASFIKTNNNNIKGGLWVLSIGLLFIFLGLSLYEISELRDSYLSPKHPQLFTYSNSLLLIRYYCLVFVTLLIFTINRLFSLIDPKLNSIKEILLSGAILWLLSSEWLHWLDIYNASNSYKLILSIFWGIYAFALVVYGLWKNKKQIRLTAIVLLGITLIKVFFYDLTHMSTLRRAILFIALGLVMLGISFLYNKYKHLISDENEELF